MKQSTMVVNEWKCICWEHKLLHQVRVTPKEHFVCQTSKQQDDSPEAGAKHHSSTQVWHEIGKHACQQSRNTHKKGQAKGSDDKVLVDKTTDESYNTNT